MIPGLILTFIKGHWRWIVPSIACIGLGATVYIQGIRISSLKSAVMAEQARYEAAVSEWHAQYEKGLREALQAKIDKEKEYASFAARADRDYADLSRAYSLRVKAMQAGIHRTAAGGSAKGDSAGIPERAGEATRLPDGAVIISIDDADICAENQAKLEAAREWALGLE